MSYIRNTSNPERLYLFSTAHGVEWHQGSQHLFTMPDELFEVVCRAYLKEQGGPVEIDGCLVEHAVRDGKVRVWLSYQGHEVEMWEVTWNEIVGNFED